MTRKPNRPVAILKGLTKVGAGLGIVAWLFWANWGELSQRDWSHLRWHFIALGALVSFGAVLLTFLRWYLLVIALGLPFRIRDSMRIGFIGYFFNLLIPGAVGGDLAKSILLAKDQKRKTAAVASVLVDRIIGLFSLILLCSAAIALSWFRLGQHPELRKIAEWTGWLLLGASVGVALLFSRHVHRSFLVRWVRRLPVVGGVFGEAVDALQAYGEKKPVLLVTIAMSVIGHLGFVTAYRCTQLAMPYEPPPAFVHYMLAPLGVMVSAIPLTPGGVGIAEGAMAKLFEYAGYSGALALMMMLSYRGIQIATALFGMGYYLLSRSETRQALQEDPVNVEAAAVS